MQEGREVGGDIVRGLGFSGVDVCPPGLLFLASLEVGGWTPQRLRRVDGSILLLTGREPTFEEALDWFQFAYTVDRASAYVAPESTVLA